MSVCGDHAPSNTLVPFTVDLVSVSQDLADAPGWPVDWSNFLYPRRQHGHHWTGPRFCGSRLSFERRRELRVHEVETPKSSQSFLSSLGPGATPNSGHQAALLEGAVGSESISTPRVERCQMLASDHRSLHFLRTGATCGFGELPRRLLFQPSKLRLSRKDGALGAPRTGDFLWALPFLHADWPAPVSCTVNPSDAIGEAWGLVTSTWRSREVCQACSVREKTLCRRVNAISAHFHALGVAREAGVHVSVTQWRRRFQIATPVHEHPRLSLVGQRSRNIVLRSFSEERLGDRWSKFSRFASFAVSIGILLHVCQVSSELSPAGAPSRNQVANMESHILKSALALVSNLYSSDLFSKKTKRRKATETLGEAVRRWADKNTCRETDVLSDSPTPFQFPNQRAGTDHGCSPDERSYERLSLTLKLSQASALKAHPSSTGTLRAQSVKPAAPSSTPQRRTLASRTLALKQNVTRDRCPSSPAPSKPGTRHGSYLGCHGGRQDLAR